METIITVQKPDGSTKLVTRQGHITDADARSKIEASAVKMGAVVIAWELKSPAPAPAQRPVIVSGRARRRFEQYNQQRPRFNSDNTARCKGCGRIGDDGECGLGNY